MSTRDLILIIVAIIISGVIIGGCVLIASEPQNNDGNVTVVNNNTTNNTTQLNASSTGDDPGYTYSKQSDSYVKNSGETYDTGSKDSNGEKIYAHRYAKDGVVYETYKSSSGREIDPNEYYA